MVRIVGPADPETRVHTPVLYNQILLGCFMHKRKLKIYIGYDSREDIAYQVCRHSLIRRSRNQDLEVYPLKQSTLREIGLYTRPLDAASTEFSLTRFLTPYLAAHDGWSIFTDCDFLYSVDIEDVLDGLDPKCAVHVVQHDYTPAHTTKMDGIKQSTYPRKNWSSFILFNGSHPDVQTLNPTIVNSQSPAYLHRFNWVKNENHIGSLPLKWNFLVGEYPKSEKIPAAVHYTNGGPWFGDWQNVDYADEWREERDLYLKESNKSIQR